MRNASRRPTGGRRCPLIAPAAITRTKYKVQSWCTGLTAARDQTEEHRRRNSEANKGHSVSEETGKRLSEANRGETRPSVGFSYDKRGYKRLSGQQDHPLAWAGQVLAARFSTTRSAQDHMGATGAVGGRWSGVGVTASRPTM